MKYKTTTNNWNTIPKQLQPTTIQLQNNYIELQSNHKQLQDNGI